MHIRCLGCKTTINIQGNEKGQYIDEGYSDPIDHILYTLIKCPVCSSPIVSMRQRVFEFGAFDFGAPIRKYPVSEFHINNEIPEALRNSLAECVNCYEAGFFTPTAIMCRRTLDGFCSLKGAKEYTLAASLKKLKNEGIISEEIYSWAVQLKNIGNDAAHNFESKYTADDAKEILDFTIAILDFTYSYKEKFEKFQQKHKK